MMRNIRPTYSQVTSNRSTNSECIRFLLSKTKASHIKTHKGSSSSNMRGYFCLSFLMLLSLCWPCDLSRGQFQDLSASSLAALSPRHSITSPALLYQTTPPPPPPPSPLCSSLQLLNLSFFKDCSIISLCYC